MFAGAINLFRAGYVANIYKLRTVNKPTNDFDLETNPGRFMSEIHHIERIITTSSKPATEYLSKSALLKPDLHHQYASIEKPNSLPSLFFILSYPC